MPLLHPALRAALLALLLLLLPGVAEWAWPASFTRGGSDQLQSASLASGGSLSFGYDASHGQITGIVGGGYGLSIDSDALLHLPLSQTVKDQASGDTLLSATITYDAGGLRASRTVSAGSEGEGSATTSYWYGGFLHPLVVTRDGVTYRLIGKGIVEQAGDQPSRSYLHGDYLGSVRMITDDQGKVVQSLGYDDYGLTRIEGQSASASFDSMASFYRFQGQEQEVFPLAELGTDDDALAQWLDQIGLYHYPWRDYAAGLAAFTETDPMPREDSLYSAFAANPVNFTDETGGMIGALDTIDPQTQRLLDRVATMLAHMPTFTAHPFRNLTLDQIRKMEVAYYGVLGEGNNEFLRQRDALELLLQRVQEPNYRGTVRDRMVLRSVETGRPLSMIEERAAAPYLSLERSVTQQEVQATLDRFNERLGEYLDRRLRWLEKYRDAIALAQVLHERMAEADDDEKDDEKADVLNERRGIEEESSVRGADDETRPLLDGADSDDDVVQDLTVGGDSQSNAPAPQFHVPSGDDGRVTPPSPRREQPGRIRCDCNIL